MVLGCAPAAIRAALRCEQPDKESVAVLSHRDFHVGLSCHAQKALTDRDRLLVGIEPDLEDLLRSFQLSDQFLELPLLLLAFASGRAEFSRSLTSFVHKRRIGFANCDHSEPLLRAQGADQIDLT